MKLGEVDKILQQMHSEKGVDKGSFGEKAVLRICEEFYQKYGGILIHSYSYAVDRELPGNIKRHDDGTFYLENLGSTTEIDVLLITPYRIYPIEVKAYAAKKILLYDDRIEGCRITEKSPVHQNEMHCRHLYSHLFKSIPNGDIRYIVPCVCFVDKCELVDNRSDWQRSYIPAFTLNYLNEFIQKTNTPLEYRLDLKSVDNSLKEAESSVEKKFQLLIKGED